VFLFSRAFRYHICPHFPSVRLSICSLLRRRNLSSTCSPIYISYRIVLYSNTYLSPSKRLTNLFTQPIKVWYMYSGNQELDNLRDIPCHPNRRRRRRCRSMYTQ
jgi:hypothetical protein